MMIPDAAVAASAAREGAPLPMAGDDLEVRLARDGRDLRAAQRLRFEVFNLEMRLGLAGSFARGLDSDAFDPYCDHVLVVDRRQGDVVGTYRLLSSDRVPSFGFYSETEFQIDNIRRTGARLLELGRSCVAPDHRSGRVIQLLFRGVAAHARATGARYLMGCASVRGNDIDELREIYTLLATRYGAGPEALVIPKRGFDIPGIEVPAAADDGAIFRKLPPLFKGYLRLGAKVCGPPAFDRHFGTTDFFLMADAAGIAERYGRRYLPQAVPV